MALGSETNSVKTAKTEIPASRIEMRRGGSRGNRPPEENELRGHGECRRRSVLPSERVRRKESHDNEEQEGYEGEETIAPIV